MREDDNGEYIGPHRRRGEPGYQGPRGNGSVKLHGPAWLGRLELSGQFVIAMLALLIVAGVAGLTAFLSYRAAEAHGTALATLQKSETEGHGRIIRSVDELWDLQQQSQCLQAIERERERRDAIRSGDVCGFIGLFPRRPYRSAAEGPR